MDFSIQKWGSQVYSSWTSYLASLPAHEVFAKKCKILLTAPSLLALSVQKLGTFPWQSAVVACVVADLAFHHLVETSQHPNVHYKVRKFEKLIDAARLVTLIWSVGHLIQSLSLLTPHLPLTAEAILKVYTTCYRRHKFVYYRTHFSDQWLLSWPATFIAFYTAKALKKWVIKDQLYLDDLSKQDKISLKELYLPLWKSVMQIMTFVSLAVFSKSHLTFTILSTLSLYTFYQRFSQRKMWIELNFTKRDVNFQYEELFYIKKNVKEEVKQESNRLLKEMQFQTFNQLKKEADCYRLYVNKIPFSASDLNQIVHKNYSSHKSGDLTQVQLTCIQDYQPGEQIDIYLDPQELNESKEDFLTVKLEDGTSACFPDVLRRMVLAKKFGGKTIKAQIISKDCDPQHQLTLKCSSSELPEWEKVYVVGEEIKVYLDPQQCQEGTSKNLTIDLEDGMCVSFPHVLRSEILTRKLQGTTITALIISRKGSTVSRLILECESIDFPEEKKLCFKRQHNRHNIKYSLPIYSHPGRDTCATCSSTCRVYQYGDSQAKNVNLCRDCILTDFENKVNNINIFNLRQKGLQYEACVEEALPEGMVLYAGESGPKISIVHINYQIHQQISVPIRAERSASYDFIQDALFAFLSDGTTVCFPNVSSGVKWRLDTLPSSLIARIIRKYKQDDILYLDCVSPLINKELFNSIQNTPEIAWKDFLDGILVDLDRHEVQQQINTLQTRTALYLFLQKVKNRETKQAFLDIEEHANRATIQNAYKKKTMVVHPDRNPQRQELAKILFQVLSKAYDSLCEQVYR